MGKVIIGLILLIGLVVSISCGTSAPHPEEDAVSASEESKNSMSDSDTPRGAQVPATAMDLTGESWATNRMIVRTGNLEMKVKDVTYAVDEVRRIASSLEGYEVSSQVYGGEDNNDTADISIRVPAHRYDEAMMSIKDLALEILLETSEAKDVTEDYTDLESKLRNLEATEQRYLDILEKAESVEEILEVEGALSTARGEIEQTKGRMQYLERTASTSLILVHMEEERALEVDFEASKLEIEEGKYRGTRGTGYWVNSIWYSERLDVDDPAASIKFHLLANQLGLDGDMASVVLSWAFECYERGLLTKAETDGLELEWGNGDAMVKMMEKLAYRQDIGDFLADGVKEASRKLGKGSEKFAIHMKGQDSVDPYRIRKGWGFGLSTSPVAGRHLRGAVSSPEYTGPRDLAFSPTEYENIPEAVFWQLRAKEIEDMTGICNYVGTYVGAHALGPSDYAELVSSAMGIDLSEQEFMEVGRRSYNLEKAFNTIHTEFDRKDDFPPERYMEESAKSGPYAGHKCDRDRWDEMLDRFYELHGWDKETGLQTRRCLAELGMEDVAKQLEEVNKLVD